MISSHFYWLQAVTNMWHMYWTKAIINNTRTSTPVPDTAGNTEFLWVTFWPSVARIIVIVFFKPVRYFIHKRNYWEINFQNTFQIGLLSSVIWLYSIVILGVEFGVLGEMVRILCSGMKILVICWNSRSISVWAMLLPSLEPEGRSTKWPTQERH
jgi:hypothetical protein